MSETLARIKECEAQIEEVLWSLEIAGESGRSLEAYQNVEASLRELLEAAHPSERAEAQRVLAYCLLREGNMLRVMGRPDDASRLSEREIDAARASGDSLTLARSLMSRGTNLLVGGDIEQGRRLLEEARVLFSDGDSRDHKQGLGWCWVLQADLMNAGLVPGDAGDAVEAAGQALSELLPIESWPGVARAYGARAAANERLGDAAFAKRDREAQQEYEAKVQADARRGM